MNKSDYIYLFKEACGSRCNAEYNPCAFRQAADSLAKLKPVAFRHLHEDGYEYYDAPTGIDCNECEPLYTVPLRKEWVELTLNDITGHICDCDDDDGTHQTSCFIDYAKAIEQKLKDLNT